MTTATLHLLTPEIVLIVAAVAIYLGGAFWTAPRAWRWIVLGTFGLAATALWRQGDAAAVGGPLNVDELAWFGRWLALAFGALLLLLAWRPQSIRHTPCAGAAHGECGLPSDPARGACGVQSDTTPEYLGSLLLTIAGLMLVAAAADLVLLFVALELISIPTYVLLYLGRRDAECQEAAAKYFFLSVLSSAILLYGFSFLYGLGGSTELSAVRAAMDGTKLPIAGFAAFSRLAMVLVFAGLCFKIAAVPFHFYAPDVYQGTTYPNAALLSVVPKAAGFVVLVRILVAALPGMGPQAWQIVLVISVLTMTLGNTMALWQNDLRRLLAYSSIAHAGYMLLALAVGMASGGTAGDWNGIGALWFYLVTYAAATLGAFAAAEHLGRPDRRLDAVDELAGLGRTRPAAAAVLAVCMFSLTGVPPLAGFWGKLLIFGSALNADGQTGAAAVQWWFVAAAVIGVLNAAVSAAYYLRVVAVTYFRTPLATPRAQGGAGAWWVAVACALVLVGVGVFPGPLMDAANRATIEGSAVNTPASTAKPQVLSPKS
jgi:NADH-quinone oxidoreductase subunit N